MFALMQSFVLLLCMFLCFKLIVVHSGMEGLGLWSLLMIFGGVATTIDVSGAGALSRTVARHGIEFADVPQASVVHTVLLTSFGINALLSLVLMTLAHYLLPKMVSIGQLIEARRLLPFVAMLIVSRPLAVGVASAIDGLMRADLRGLLLSGAALCGLAVAWLAIPRWGIRGFAIGQLVQQGLTICGGWLLLRRHIAGFGWLPFRWQGSVFRRTTAYAIKLNVIGAMGLLLEPLTKYCINLVGGVAAVGTYELAARLITQLRGLIVSAAIPAIPVFAAQSHRNERFVNLLTQTKRNAAFAALAVALVSVLAAPLMCWFILGDGNGDVLRMNALLTFGWSINLLALPIYIAAQGQGVLRWNLMSGALNGAGVAAGYLLFGQLAGQIVVVAGVTAGLVAGALAAIWGNGSMFGAQAALRQSAPLSLAVATAIAGVCALGWFAAEPVTRLIQQVAEG